MLGHLPPTSRELFGRRGQSERAVGMKKLLRESSSKERESNPT